MDLEAYRGRAERFLQEVNAAHRRRLAGFGDGGAVAAAYDRHAALFDPGAIAGLRDARASCAPGSEAAWRGRELLAFAIEGRTTAATRELDAQRDRIESTLMLDVGTGAPVAFRSSLALQAAEADPARRAAIEAARLAAVDRWITPTAAATIELAHAVTRELGWPDHVAMVTELSGIDLVALERETHAFTAATEPGFAGVVDDPLRRATGVALADARRSDLPRFFRAPEFDGGFPPGGLGTAYRGTLAALDLAGGGQPGVRVDLEPRRGKSRRAFCVPVQVPGEVHLVIAPAGGRDDYAAVLHEAGHAQHYSHVTPALAFEPRRLGDSSVSEAFAFLFEGLVGEPRWLRDRLGIEDDDGRLAAHARAERLIYLRRYAAKLGYELELHRAADLDGLDVRYAERLGDGLQMPWPREPWLTDLDPGLYTARYLRAWALAASLRRTLRERFGDAWFTVPAAGAFLRSLWWEGQRRDAAELCEAVTGRALEFAVVLEELGVG